MSQLEPHILATLQEQTFYALPVEKFNAFLIKQRFYKSDDSILALSHSVKIDADTDSHTHSYTTITQYNADGLKNGIQTAHASYDNQAYTPQKLAYFENGVLTKYVSDPEFITTAWATMESAEQSSHTAPARATPPSVVTKYLGTLLSILDLEKTAPSAHVPLATKKF